MNILEKLMEGSIEDPKLLDEIISSVEKATNLDFPAEVRHKIRSKIVTSDELYQATLEIGRDVFGKKPPENYKLKVEELCKITKKVSASANPLKNIIFLCEENINHHLGKIDRYAPYIMELLLCAHEVGHILLDKLIPEFRVKLRAGGFDNVQYGRLNLLNEYFADYSLIKFGNLVKNELKGYDTRVLDKHMLWLINCYSINGSYFNSLLDSEDPLKCVREGFSL